MPGAGRRCRARLPARTAIARRPARALAVRREPSPIAHHRPRNFMTAKKSAAATSAKLAKPTPKAALADALEKVRAAKPALKAAARPAAKAPAEARGKAGRKGKAVVPEVTQPEAVTEDDFDVETEFVDGDAEVAEEAEVKAAKAKPLRMKVSRAKERALMREFGLDETALTEEEVAKRRLELK